MGKSLHLIFVLILTIPHLGAKDYYPEDVQGCYVAMLVGSGTPPGKLNQVQNNVLGLLKINSRVKGLYKCCTNIGKTFGKISRTELEEKIKYDECGSSASNYQIKKQMIKQSIASYPSSCACPYSRAKNGSQCGKRSAYSKKGGRTVLCYESDISSGMVERYQRTGRL